MPSAVLRLGTGPVLLALLVGVLSGCPERRPRYVEPGDAGPEIFDADQVARWEHCPPRTRPPAIEGGLWIQTSPTATYCTARSPFGTLAAAFAGSEQVRLVPADLFLPLDEGEHAIDVATCLRRRSGGTDGKNATQAQWTVEKTSVLGTESLSGTLLQSYDDGSVMRLRISGQSSVFPRYPDQNGGGILLDGIVRGPTIAPTVEMVRCPTSECLDPTPLVPCAFPPEVNGSDDTRQLEFSFSGGTIAVRYAVGFEGLGVIEAQAIEATGTFRDVAIDVSARSTTDAFWHFWNRNRSGDGPYGVVVPFGETIDELCGIGFFSVDVAADSFTAVPYFCNGNTGSLEEFSVIELGP